MRLRSPAWDGVVYWALDLETGGLDPRRDAILEVGMVPIRDAHVRLGEGWRTLVRPEGNVDPRSIAAHQLVARETRDAPALGEVMREVDRRLDRDVLLVHHRGVDVPFLRRGYRDAGLRWRNPVVVDTVELLFRQARRAHRLRPELPAEPPTVNLSAAREQLGLPAYEAHDALSDAVATAELFLVLRQALGARTLRELST
jgi:DNA polymerase III subunit epsilon